MKPIYLLVVEGEAGKGFGAYFPDLPGIYPLGSTVKEIKTLARQGAAYLLEDLAEEGRPLPKPMKRTDRQIDALLSDMQAEYKLQAFPLVVPYGQ